jgi:hypothetical protein
MISTALNLPQSIWNSLIPFWQTISIFFLLQRVWQVVYAAQIKHSESRKLLTKGQRPIYFLLKPILRFICTKFHPWVNNRGKYVDGSYNSIINDRDGHIPSPLIMFSYPALRHSLLESEKNKGVHLQASKSKLKADRPHRSNYFNYHNDGGKNKSCCAATERKLSTSPGISNTYTLLMNTWNTLPESYQQRVYKNTLATVKRKIQQVENPTGAVVIGVEAAHVHNAIVLQKLTSEVALEEPHIGNTHPTILMDNNCTYDNLHFGMPGGSEDNEDAGDESSKCDAIPTANRLQRPMTNLRELRG